MKLKDLEVGKRYLVFIDNSIEELKVQEKTKKYIKLCFQDSGTFLNTPKWYDIKEKSGEFKILEDLGFEQYDFYSAPTVSGSWKWVPEFLVNQKDFYSTCACNPANGGSGVCNCTLSNPITFQTNQS